MRCTARAHARAQHALTAVCSPCSRRCCCRVPPASCPRHPPLIWVALHRRRRSNRRRAAATAPPRRRERAPPRALEGPIWPYFGRGWGVWAVGEGCAVCACTLGVRGARGTAAGPRGISAKLRRGRRAALSAAPLGRPAAPVTISMFQVSGVSRRGSGRLVAGLAVPHGHTRCSESRDTTRHHLYWSSNRA